VTDLVMRRTETGLEPVGNADALAKIKIGAQVLVKISNPRSIKQHRLFFGLLTYVANATEFETPEAFLIALKVAMGRYDLVKLPNGKVVPHAQSISFASMDGEKFRVFFDDALNLICRDVLPGMSPEEMIGQAGLTSAVAEMRAIPPGSTPVDAPTLHPDAVWLIEQIDACKNQHARDALMDNAAAKAKYKALPADQKKAVTAANDAATEAFKADGMIERSGQL